MWMSVVVQNFSIIYDANDVDLSVAGNSCLYIYSLH